MRPIKYPFTEEVKSFLIENYPIYGNKFCAKKLGVPKGTVMFWTGKRRLNLPKITKENRGLIIRREHGFGVGVDWKIFIENFTKESVYLLGLLWADGNVNKNRISVTCAKDDAVDYMKTFKKTGEWRHFDEEKNRYGTKTKDTRTIYIGNSFFAEKLRELGYTPNNKESPDTLLSKIPENLKHYWFRGLFDGDGCFKHRADAAMCCLTITAPFDQKWHFLENLSKTLGITHSLKKERYINRHGKTNSRSVYIITNAKSLKIFMDYIFQGKEEDGIGLKRKYEKYLKYKEIAKTRPKIGYLFQ